VTPADVITEVRRIIQDTRAPLRYTNELLLGFVNQTLKRMVMLRPDLFSEILEVATTPNTVLQALPDDSVRLIEVFQVKGGRAIAEVSRSMINRNHPLWTSAPAGTPVNYMRHLRNPNRFFLYPPPVAGVTVIAEYARTPPEYALDDNIVAPSDVYFPAIVDGTVFLAEAIDNEHVNSGRAQMFQDSFAQLLGVSLQSRTITDTEAAGVEPSQVVQ
jgi:hypothetical protein